VYRDFCEVCHEEFGQADRQTEPLLALRQQFLQDVVVGMLGAV
jgi:hypothetical protein